MTPVGLPHSGTHGSKPAYDSPWHFAVNRALHRLLAPRHPPYALSSLTKRLRHFRFFRCFISYLQLIVFNLCSFQRTGCFESLLSWRIVSIAYFSDTFQSVIFAILSSTFSVWLFLVKKILRFHCWSLKTKQQVLSTLQVTLFRLFGMLSLATHHL